MTGCQGELAGEEFDVLIKDSDGNIVIDETMTAPDHGFLDLWLPRNDTYHVAIGHDGKTTGGEISTFEGDDTCITTMQLS
ncbi:hypothetical protein C6Y45_09880 [Alkalicoccus saliphilus]|uniref:Uncharacterized protein n=1 Tax=Alkalicoccus saliphilus TaxID=200989 RepID=A0A2T4U5I8_9BACI|nr:CueP family metal-binding protein [Alkalicoccus saliphilus]PTL38654.1 hypothetical protein C6Y45_09880 [Alkalicoccus saliphilus]